MSERKRCCFLDLSRTVFSSSSPRTRPDSKLSFDLIFMQNSRQQTYRCATMRRGFRREEGELANHVRWEVEERSRIGLRRSDASESSSDEKDQDFARYPVAQREGPLNRERERRGYLDSG